VTIYKRTHTLLSNIHLLFFLLLVLLISKTRAVLHWVDWTLG